MGNRKKQMTMKIRIGQRIRARRARLGFERALDQADPAMRQELIVMASRQSSIS
jgi:hypothetical protein